MPTPTHDRFFRTPAAFGRWPAANYAMRDEVWMAFRRKATGRPAPSWAEMVDESLCWGWIDDLRKRLDDWGRATKLAPLQGGRRLDAPRR